MGTRSDQHAEFLQIPPSAEIALKIISFLGRKAISGKLYRAHLNLGQFSRIIFVSSHKRWIDLIYEGHYIHYTHTLQYAPISFYSKNIITPPNLHYKVFSFSYCRSRGPNQTLGKKVIK